MLRQLWSYRRELLGMSLYWSGVSQLFEVLTHPTGAIILMYHSISGMELSDFIEPRNRLSPEMFERQMDFLSKYRCVIALSDLVNQIKSGKTPVAGTVCITFDDGYLDNLKTAAPLLEQFQLPATLFLATQYIDQGTAQWADVLHWLFSCRTTNKLSIPLLGNITYDLSLPAKQLAARKLLHLHLLTMMNSERKDLLIEIQQQLLPKGRMPQLTLTWADVRELQSRYPLFDIGGHTREHVDLYTHGGDIAHREINGCAEDIQRELKNQPKHFSFPYGRSCTETRHMVAAGGWQSAVVTSVNQRIHKLTDQFAMPRVEAPRNMTDLRFKTSGSYPSIFSVFGLR